MQVNNYYDTACKQHQTQTAVYFACNRCNIWYVAEYLLFGRKKNNVAFSQEIWYYSAGKPMNEKIKVAHIYFFDYSKQLKMYAKSAET